MTDGHPEAFETSTVKDPPEETVIDCVVALLFHK